MRTAQLTIPVVCPSCHGELVSAGGGPACRGCRRQYGEIDGFADLVIGEHYDDDTPDCAVLNEETTNRETVDRYWIPLFRRLWPAGSESKKILSLGCGVGADVDRLVEHGFDAFGLDNGKRTALWAARRSTPERLFRANGKRMPFPAGTFDAIFCGCVFPHVGVVGTTFNTSPDFVEQRTDLAREMARVLRPGGYIITCNPNRFFPFDIFHGHQAGKFVLRPTKPWDRLLLSRGDYLRLFRPFGCVRATALPVEGYWNFTNSRKTVKGRILAAPVSWLFRMVSRGRLLRGSPLNPWLIVLLEKG